MELQNDPFAFWISSLYYSDRKKDTDGKEPFGHYKKLERKIL